MIYLFKVDYYSDTEAGHKLTLLKIGYSSKLYDRLKNHLTSQPRLEVLGWKEGTKEHEAELHNKFSKFKYRNTREWYRYNEDIVKEFMDGSFKEIETLNSTFTKFFGLCKLGNKVSDILRYVKEKSIELELQEEFKENKQHILSHIIDFSNDLYDREYFDLTNPILKLFPDTLLDDGETEYEVEYTRLGPKIIKDNLNITLTKDSVIKDALDLTRNDTYYTIITDDVLSIVDIIKEYNLSPNQVNILCEDTDSIRLTIKELSRNSNNLSDGFKIGSVPLKGEPRKLVTLCTRTVYLGADFYSDNFRSVVISDANINTLSVDLPQVLGRQRLSENPWKNEVEIYAKCIMPKNVEAQEEFASMRSRKLERTANLLSAYCDAKPGARNDLAETFEQNIEHYHFKFNYVAVNTHAGSSKIAVENKLVQIAEERAYDIQQIDYASRFSVFSTIKESLRLDTINEIRSDGESVEKFLNIYKNCDRSCDRLKVICEFKFSNRQDQREALLNYVPLSYRNYYYGLGPEKCKELGYNISKIKSELQRSLHSDSNESLSGLVTKEFKPSTKLSKSDIKSKLKEIYSSLSYDKTPKASDLEEWFDIKPCKIKNEETGKWEHGFEILGIK